LTGQPLSPSQSQFGITPEPAPVWLIGIGYLAVWLVFRKAACPAADCISPANSK